MDRDDTLATGALTLEPLPENQAVLSAHIRPRDLPSFYALQERNQERIRRLLSAFALIDAAPTYTLGYDMAASAMGGQRGFSAKRLRILHSDWRKSRDWRCLIDQALEYKPAETMPRDFIDYLNAEADKNGRSITSAIKHIRRDWTLGKDIPGYGTWQAWWKRTHPGRPLPRIAPGFPNGWTTRNLSRKIDTSKFRRAAATLGRISARRHRPLVLSTRQGCYVGSHYMWDDVWHDLFVNSLTEKQAGRPLELFSHDYYSAKKMRWGIRVRTEDDNGKAQGLTGRMMRMVIAATYYLDGYSPRGTINVAEHGTAAFMDTLAGALYDASGGLITVQESGMQGKGAHAGQYDGRSIGNPNFKASLESSNNLLHNMEAHLPGQTGPDRQRRPEQLHGLLTYNARLIAAAQHLPADQAALLQYPLLEVGQYMQVLSSIYDFIGDDPEHDLEGWVDCGHVTQELQILGEWKTQDALLALPGDQQQLVIAMLNSGMVPTRPRKMTRNEVFHRGARDLVKIHGGTVCQILGDDFAAERKVRSHQFVFEDREVGPGEHRYEAIIEDAEGREHALREGEIYKAFVNPFAIDQLFVQDAKGRFLGTARRCQRASRSDVDALKRAMGRAQHLETELLAPLAKRQASEARKKLAMHRNNADVVARSKSSTADFQRLAAAALDASLSDDEPEADLSPTHPTHDIDPTDY